MAAISQASQNETSLMFQNTVPSCRYCNGLDRKGHMKPVPAKDWVEGIVQSSCELCRIVVQSIKKIDSKLFDDISKRNGDIGIIVSGHARVLVRVFRECDGTSRTLLFIELYTHEKHVPSELSFVGSGRDISPISGDKAMWTFLRDCFRECTLEHSNCLALQDVGWYPDRLLYLGKSAAGDEPTLQLIESRDHAPDSRYITLSYCWGEYTPICTTSKNIERHRKEIDYAKLPRTFRDCITVAQQLGIQYVWIDSLCIQQDSRTDWAHHSHIMDQVYENALLTVAAVSSSNPSIPFLGPDAPSTRDRFQPHDIDVSAITKFTSIVKARQYTALLIPGFIHGPLEARAWAWQERHISTRKINFTEQEVHWECATLKTCECSGSQRTGHLNKIARHSLKTTKDWRAVVESYSGRQLTYWSDRLPALSGMASRFNKSIDSEYLAGIWLLDFPKCLSWYRRELSDCPVGKPCMWRSLDISVPSWSWASISGNSMWLWAIDFDLVKFEEDEIHITDSQVPEKNRAELVAYNCRPVHPENPFGEVMPGAYIEIKGRVIEAEMESDLHGCGLVRRPGLKAQFMVPDCHIISEEDHERERPNLIRKVFGQNIKGDEKNISPGGEWLRRALPTDKLKHTKCHRSKGTVVCLLLYTIEKNHQTRPCILILSQQAPVISTGQTTQHTYQRVGISAGNLNFNGPQYEKRKDWECWEGWEDLGVWEEWEEWFSDAEEKTLRIV